MALSPAMVQDRFRGCLLGLAIGDALGAKFEAQSAEAIRQRFPSVDALIDYPKEEIWYTDDTQMCIGVAEALCARGTIVEETICAAFVANYVPSRGYGRGARAVLEAMEDGRDYRAVAQHHFPGGSYGNGAAMRVAPVGLLFRDDRERLREEARLSALPTHVHPLGIEGAQLIALAVALASSQEVQLDRASFSAALIAACTMPEYREKMEQVARIQAIEDLAGLGNRIEALHSAPTAIASFFLSPESYEATIAQLVFLGGDTDTLAAMAGGISGAYLGAGRLPARLVQLLESSPKGRDYLINLADQLWIKYSGN